jgi:phosphoglycerate dehydrogenase-like enzyme
VTHLVLPRPLTDDFVLTPAARDVLARVEVKVVTDTRSDALGAADVFVTGISTETLDPLEIARQMPNLRWIHTMTAGIGSVASPELLARDILVTNAAGAYAPAIAEYTFAALVLLTRGLPELLVASSQRRWADHALGLDLAGKRIGIIGLGGIGRRVASLCLAAGMHVRAIRRSPTDADRDVGFEVGPPGDLDALLASSDAIVVAASSNPTTQGLLSARELALMPPHALLVNVSRGQLVDEPALMAALHERRLGGAVLDVTATEPLPPDSPLWSAPNLWITPHMAGGTLESRARSLELLVENLDRYLAGDRNLVNRVDLSAELRRA